MFITSIIKSNVYSRFVINVAYFCNVMNKQFDLNVFQYRSPEKNQFYNEVGQMVVHTLRVVEGYKNICLTFCSSYNDWSDKGLKFSLNFNLV